MALPLTRHPTVLTLRAARVQDDFEMAVAKVMKKDNEKNMSLKKLWK